jgi:hypothetical protein
MSTSKLVPEILSPETFETGIKQFLCHDQNKNPSHHRLSLQSFINLF